MAATARERALLDLFYYVESCAPDDFPEEDGATLDSVLNELREGVAASRSARGAAELFALVEREMEEAERCFRAGKEDLGRDSLERGREYFNRAVSGTR